MAPKPYRIHVPEEVLDDLKHRLHHVRWPNQPENTGWERGTEMTYLQTLVTYWRDHYDWRAQEARLNRFSQYRCNVNGIDIHFVHERGKGPHPLPLILTHGWPDSFLRYEKIIPLLIDPASYGGRAEDAFDVIVPSVPGFGFSGRPTHPGMNNAQVAELWVKLMTEELGYEKFAAAGGDVGSGVTRYLAANHPELLYGIHLTDIGIIRALMNSSEESELSAEERRYQQAASAWVAQEGGYMSIQTTRPQTLAYGLSDSPVGLASWILEKLRTWSDCDGDLRQRFTEDELLTHIMIYWVTNTVGSAAHLYYENTHTLPPLGYITVPTALALFKADILPPPKEWAMRNLNISRWTSIPRGGHFTAMEEPELMADDLRAFFRSYRVSP
ncbi:MAG: epoxide hydrolase [Paenibacillus sp.]|uniref:epoxide hydrolase family protein n=1 Tax=Paenibacillus sp. TaxID=58172 RepID=UPI002906F583|nr:epoxide hydrolase [Paenibacillus sp.]MDU4695889.1 epoxide hydrolase [Paenibacillus sp.]